MPVLQPRRASRFEASEAPGATEVLAETEASPTTPRPDPPALPRERTGTRAPSGPPVVAGPPLPSAPGQQPSTSTEPPAKPEPSPLDGGLLQEFTPLLVSPEPAILFQTVQVAAPATEPPPQPSRADGPFREAATLRVDGPQPRLLPEPPPARPREAGAPSARSQPEHREDIHISIGRIEIRALPAKAAPASRQPQASGPSTLDTYLQQRGGRRNQ
jgi:hypothetical protein